MSDQADLTRRNLARSRGIILIAFAINAGLNVVLLGLLSKLGGLALVGQWSFLSAILLFVLLLDFGITNALTFRIGRDGVEAIAPILRTLLAGLLGVALLCIPAGLVAHIISPEWGWPLAISVIAATGELSSNWLISVRMGQHEQYWFNVKTVVRITLQTAFALVLYKAMPDLAPLAFALAFLIARSAELLLAWCMVRRQFKLLGALENLREIPGLAKGFGLLSIAVKAQEPLARLMISAFSGQVALGVFTVARRIPAVVDQSVSEALRALLPGMSRLRSVEERDKVLALLCEAVAGQLVMIGPAMLAIAIHSGLLFQVWLGQSTQTLTISLDLLLVGTLFNAVTRPFFWTVQGFGDADKLARLMLARVGLTLMLGGVVLWLHGTIEVFVFIFAVSQIITGLLVFLLTNRYDGLANQVIRRLPMVRIIAFLLGVTLLNLLLVHFTSGLSPNIALLVVFLCNAVIGGPVGMLLLRDLKKAVA